MTDTQTETGVTIKVDGVEVAARVGMAGAGA